MADDDDLAETLPVQPGTVLGGKYRVVKLLAAGGMGAVLLAHHEILDKPVAIKLIRPELASHKQVAQRFMREARAAAKISSDYVARVTDVELLDNKTPYMVMEYLEGEDLSALMSREGKLPIALAVDHVLQGLMGLGAAHAKGVVHRDLKPSNLFLEKRGDGTRRVKLLDFGISKVLEGEGDDALKAGASTSAGQMLGTPRYMSPEQVASAKDVDERTDLWAMGLILYELLTGLYPFDGSSSGQIMSAILTQSIRPLRDLRPEAPAELEQIVARSLAKNRDERFQESRHMMRALAPFASRRLQSLVSEQDEVHGDPTATARSPDAVGALTPATAPTTPVGGNATAATRAHPPGGAAAPGAQSPAERTRVSGESSVSAGRRSGTASRETAPGAGPPAPQTDTSMFADSTPARRSTWKLAAAALLVAGAGSLAFWLATRDPPHQEPSAARAATAADGAAGSMRPAQEPPPAATATAPATTVITPVFPESLASATGSAAASAAVTVTSASAAAPVATLGGPRPRASTQPQPGSSGVRLNTRD